MQTTPSFPCVNFWKLIHYKMGVIQTFSISVVYSCKKKMGIFPLISILTILNTEELHSSILYTVICTRSSILQRHASATPLAEETVWVATHRNNMYLVKLSNIACIYWSVHTNSGSLPAGQSRGVNTLEQPQTHRHLHMYVLNHNHVPISATHTA